MSTTMTVRLDDDVKDRLEVLAEATQRSKSFLAAEAIRPTSRAMSGRLARSRRR